MNIIFRVDNQRICRIDKNTVIADSRNYLYAKFMFVTNEWTGTKTVIFQHKNDLPIEVILDDNMCKVPWEVIKAGSFSVSVYCGDLITTNTSVVMVGKSGYAEAGEPQEPTPDVYTQIIEMLDTLKAGGADEESINAAITKYMEENPVQTLTVDDVNTIIENAELAKASDIPSVEGLASETFVTEAIENDVVHVKETDFNSKVTDYLAESDVATTEYVDGKLYKTIDERGKNLLCLKDAEYESNGVKVVIKDQLITISGTPISTSSHNLFALEVDMPSVLNGTYYITSYNIVNGVSSGCQNSTRIRIFDKDDTQVGEKTSIYENAGNVVTLDNLLDFTIKLLVQAQYTYTDEWSFNLQLEEGETKTAYEKAYHTITKELIVEELSKSVSALKSENENPLELIKQDGGMLSIFDSITCIGDSLTAGCFEHTETGSTVWTTIEKYSYPSHIAKMTGCKVQNYGRSGRTALDGDNSWLTWADSQGWLTADDKTDAYIIALGTNDIGVEGGFTGDVTTDIAENYADNAVTSVGGYDKIIRRILENQPKAKIFCVCLPHTRNTAETIAVANTAIKAIAELYPNNCYVLDLEKYYVQRSDVSVYKAKFYNGGHRNAMGYKELANVYATYIDWIIRNNIADFANVQFVETDYSWT